ncbi:MAG: general secretion pathway protein GspA [Sphingomonas sp. 28-66-16]|nr:MAG: general secretion pathway protein GspA [Sphingomonas sp. 28-66-16]
MYDDHYGLSGRPFQLTPDPRFWFESATHKKAMAYLGYGLSQGEGFIVVTGDIGAGKTTLVGHLMATIDHDRLLAIKIVSTQIEADDLLRMVAVGLEIDPAGLVKAQLLDRIERGLHAVARSGRRTLLIVDEAQALPTGALEELRMLSNFQAGGHALLQIFLLGQPEFRERLHGSDRLEQLRQRVIAMHHLDPMAPYEIEPYLRHRLGVAGWQGRPQFTPDAFAALYHGSDGVPRRLNQLAGRVMLQGAIEHLDLIDGPLVDSVINDIARDLPGIADPTPTPTPTPMTMAPAVATPWPTEPAAPFAQPTGSGPEAEQRPPAVEQPPSRPADPDRDAARIAALEARVEEQETALRRVLTLLIDWVESDSHRPDLSSLKGGAA